MPTTIQQDYRGPLTSFLGRPEEGGHRRQRSACNIYDGPLAGIFRQQGAIEACQAPPVTAHATWSLMHYVA